MRTKEFLSQLDDRAIVQAIAKAERNTSGEIRVYVSYKKCRDVLASALRRFAKLGMHRTRQRNAVLIYFAPRIRQFAVIGDVAIHERVGDEFWQELSAEISEDLHKNAPAEAIVHAIQTIGQRLAREFPGDEGDINELPDEVQRD
jgi:uncharacterized membrane protein